MHLTPPLPEQHRIATILGTIDECIEKTEALISKLKQVKAGLMQDLLTRGIDTEGRIRDESTHEFKDTEIGRVPVEWAITLLSNIAGIIDPQPSHRTPPISNNGIPYIGIQDIDENGHINLNSARKVAKRVLNRHRERYTLKIGDFIIGKIGTVGKVIQLIEPFNYALSANILLIQPDLEKVDCNYLYFFMKSNYMAQHFKVSSKATTQSAFGINQAKIIRAIIPPFYEQQKIASLIKSIDERIDQEQSYQEKLISQKKGLMADLLTGKVQVPETIVPTS